MKLFLFAGSSYIVKMFFSVLHDSQLKIFLNCWLDETRHLNVSFLLPVNYKLHVTMRVLTAIPGSLLMLKKTAESDDYETRCEQIRNTFYWTFLVDLWMFMVTLEILLSFVCSDTASMSVRFD